MDRVNTTWVYLNRVNFELNFGRVSLGQMNLSRVDLGLINFRRVIVGPVNLGQVNLSRVSLISYRVQFAE